jgi:aspartyl-tRNA(Asn)/glutamyl-tRNA(Gln) amidotransferase subunit A
MTIDLSALTVGRIREGLRAKEFTARELADASFARIEAVDADVHAFNQVTTDLAHRAADAIDALVASGADLPPLAGVPVAF